MFSSAKGPKSSSLSSTSPPASSQENGGQQEQQLEKRQNQLADKFANSSATKRSLESEANNSNEVAGRNSKLKSNARETNSNYFYDDEREQFLLDDRGKKIDNSKKTNSPHNYGDYTRKQVSPRTGKRLPRANLAREETIEAEDGNYERKAPAPTCARMVFNFIKQKRILITLLIISCIAAIYCIPYIEIEPRIPKLLPHIPFNFRTGPLKASRATQYKTEHLFYGQVHGPESVALDSSGNMYMAIDGGFILFAHLNKSAPLDSKQRTYYDNSPPRFQSSPSTTAGQSSSIDGLYAAGAQTSLTGQQGQQRLGTAQAKVPELIKIAELNGIKQIPYERHSRRRGARADGPPEPSGGGSWRRECQLDEHIYGSHLYSGPGTHGTSSQLIGSNEIDTGDDERSRHQFVSNVLISRCSKPLGIRLSPDENYLYVIDTLNGLYRVNLKVPERPHSTQRLVSKLIDFRPNKSRSQLLPVAQNDDLPSQATGSANQESDKLQTIKPTPNGNGDGEPTMTRPKAYLNISMMAVDDLTIDYGAGTRDGDIIYLTVGSQNWPALSFIYDLLEGRPSGVVLRYDSGSNQLSVLDPIRVSHVRTSNLEDDLTTSTLHSYSMTASPESGTNVTGGKQTELFYMGIGAPRLNENDVFDDRPLHFPNGLELTADRQAILIADTTNKRILKHYIRGPRKGTTDLWAWTPNFPDNIRRGFDDRHETYWVVGCGHDPTDSVDLSAWLNSWPRVRKYILKNIYLFGWLMEMLGTYVLRSTSFRDFGYSFKIGHSLCEKACSGMMILQYNSYGDIVRSIHGREFPNDMVYYSQVNEIIDAQNQEHILYLSSPAYNYVTKIILPTDSLDLSKMNDVR